MSTFSTYVQWEVHILPVVNEEEDKPVFPDDVCGLGVVPFCPNKHWQILQDSVLALGSQQSPASKLHSAVFNPSSQ